MSAPKNSAKRGAADLSDVLGSSVTDQKNQYLTFLVNKEQFAVGILVIKEIIEYGQQAMTSVPMMPKHIRGVINLRGRVVPVVDLAARFQMASDDAGARACIVIIEVTAGETTMDIGVVVDAVDSVLEIRPTDIEPAPSFGAKIRTDFISGMGKSENGFIILLNANNVLSVEELAEMSGAAAAVVESAE